MPAFDLTRLDPDGMFGAVRDFPQQVADGRSETASFESVFSVSDADHVVVIGMGGSAIGGDLLRALARPSASVPIEVVRGYGLPAWAGPRTIVIASSYSGNTEETLSALDDALERGCRVIGLSTGGRLREVAESEGFPFLSITGGLQPRAALGYSFTALASVAHAIGLLEIPQAAWEEALRELRALSERLRDTTGNPALDLAQSLRDRLPLVYTGRGFLQPVGVRWRGQFQENAKVLAAGNAFPELNHNEIMGWDQPSPLFERAAVLVLRDAADHPRVRRRMEVTRGLLEPKAGVWFEHEAQGEHALTRMLTTVHFGDWTSLYLALIREVDPTPVTLIEDLKRTLTEG